MLDLLRLEPGQGVFELGAGSGWNAALMGNLVGSQGHVWSLEIIPEMARRARAAINALGRSNVSIVAADGGDGYAPGAPYERAIFTAGAYDLPGPFYRQITEGGLLVAVIKCEGGGDTLFVLRRTGDHFASVDAMQCGFVQMDGKHRLEGLDPICLEELPAWADLERQETSRTPFWWGGKGKASFMWRTLGLRSFLGVTEPLFKAFKSARTKERPQEEHYFGVWDHQGGSLVIARDDCLISYGPPGAKERLLRDLQRWVDLGMPTTTSLGLRVYPIGASLSVGSNQWLVRRMQSQFLWEIGPSEAR
jgi:protein-L-isoaspartate O-methyltransferase